jgi:hypothetical protein
MEGDLSGWELRAASKAWITAFVFSRCSAKPTASSTELSINYAFANLGCNALHPSARSVSRDYNRAQLGKVWLALSQFPVLETAQSRTRSGLSRHWIRCESSKQECRFDPPGSNKHGRECCDFQQLCSKRTTC